MILPLGGSYSVVGETLSLNQNSKEMHMGGVGVLSVEASHYTKNQLAKIIFNMLKGQFTENQFAISSELPTIAWQK